MDVSKFRDGRAHVRNTGFKRVNKSSESYDIVLFQRLDVQYSTTFPREGKFLLLRFFNHSGLLAVYELQFTLSTL